MITYNFHVPFPVPKKNSRVTNRKTGRSFPSKRYREWHKIASEVVSYQTRPKDAIKRCVAVCRFYAPDKRKRDLSNFWESVADLFVDLGILEDDNWFIMPIVRLEFIGIDKENPRAELTLELVD